MKDYPKSRYVLSPVDYEAWRNGYIPPSEHELIHKLHVGAAKVVLSSSLGKNGRFYLVTEDGRIPSKLALQIHRLLDAVKEDDEPSDEAGEEIKAPAPDDDGRAG